MKKIFLLPLLLLLLNCTGKQNDKTIENKLVEMKTLHKSLSDNLHKYDLYYVKDSLKSDNVKFDKIVITNLKSGTEIQKIKIDTIEMDENNIHFSIDNDVNFDGYKDIGLLSYKGNYNTSYSFWLFDKKAGQFKYNKNLSNIYNPAFLDNKKEICSKWHSGLTEFYLEKYFWKNNVLVLKEKYEENWTDKGNLKVTKLVNGTYVKKDSIIAERYVENLLCK